MCACTHGCAGARERAMPVCLSAFALPCTLHGGTSFFFFQQGGVSREVNAVRIGSREHRSPYCVAVRAAQMERQAGALQCRLCIEALGVARERTPYPCEQHI